jgi:DNA (cytosine-5)-methyltransferase 1
MNNKLRAVDFFCGAGGVTCGFIDAGINVIAGIDINTTLEKTYEENNKAKFYNYDVSKTDPAVVGSALKIEHNDNNLIFIACSPCQYYTKIKTDKENSSETRLLLEDFLTYVEYFRPGYIFIENVPGLNTNNNSPLNKFKKSLSKNNYVIDDGVLNMKYFGVPQNRNRYVLIASRVTKQISLPEEDRKNIQSVRDAISDLKIFSPITAGHRDPSNFRHTSASLSVINLKRIKATPKDGGDRRKWQEDENLQVKCYLDHTGHYDVYGRMYWEKPSPTITTKFLSYSNGRYGHPEQNRAISLREGATLQSFPLDYVFYSESQGAIAKMIGNAVPPEFAKRIGRVFMNMCKKK